MHCTLTYALPADGTESVNDSAWALLWRRFLKRDDEFRNARWKVGAVQVPASKLRPDKRVRRASDTPRVLPRCRAAQVIPRIAEGNFLVKRAVGTKPALLGTKLTHDWVVTDRYLDCSVDVASSSMATVLVGMLQQYAK